MGFKAFHEGRRLWRSVFKHRSQFGALRQFAGDRIYASNANRRFLKKQSIATCFKRKGNDMEDTSVQASQLRSGLGRARATRLEGSFGNEKNHCLLRKVKVRTAPAEIIWILFGIHTANAMLADSRMQPMQTDQARGRSKELEQAAQQALSPKSYVLDEMCTGVEQSICPYLGTTPRKAH
ncbi:MAG: hypothetical protein EPO28_15485 [Saprospiraceae bacterium]|nr:MAG: hypothetical protein EPO28_15485 [Saprospiraceae bacterium]